MAVAKFRKTTGEFYIGNRQGTFKIININLPKKYSLMTVTFKAKRGLSGIYEATVYSGVRTNDIDFNYPITDAVDLNDMKNEAPLSILRTRTHDYDKYNLFVRTFGDGRGSTQDKNIDVEIIYIDLS